MHRKDEVGTLHIMLSRLCVCVCWGGGGGESIYGGGGGEIS